MRTLLIGEAPAKAMKDNPDAPAFSSQTGEKISRMLGVRLHDAFDTTNILDYYPGKGKEGTKGDAFPKAEARKAASLMVKHVRHRRLILVGGRVANAFYIRRDVPLLDWELLWTWSMHDLPESQHDVQMAVLPHPSGINRWYNERSNYDLAKRFLVEEMERSMADGS